jgi:hypothetical protein
MIITFIFPHFMQDVRQLDFHAIWAIRGRKDDRIWAEILHSDHTCQRRL